MDKKNIEKKIAEVQERRTIEATKKDLMGPGGKLGRILRYLGSPIIFQEIDDMDLYGMFGYNEYNSAMQQIPVVGDEEDENEWNTSVEGYHFDGYSRGMHLEIKYLMETMEITVLYKGYSVYRESNGELMAYVPGDWEKMIDTLEKYTRPKIKEHKEIKKEERNAETKTMKQAIIDYLKTNWGVG